ncbi:actin-binding Rho-activating protein-like [Mya arenaria]|uniref:actin-binding Rho-activating protein-like n=1 Tax=Mya arenaria TaxID=6604 RepID=UPI0022E4B0A0|nr:actin-binding Rho-activating protein-like [Mya arenaria]XP_052789560.1 actin-binding Rho-activating protein-like [Mya arenaria]
MASNMRKIHSSLPLDNFIRESIDEDDNQEALEDWEQENDDVDDVITLRAPSPETKKHEKRSSSVPPKVRNGMVDKDGMSKSKSFWQKKIDVYEVDKLINPFSDFWGQDRSQYLNVLENAKAVWKGADKRTKLTKADDKYGHVVEGTLTEYRGKKAKNFIAGNIIECCETIRSLAGQQQPDGTYQIAFGLLFKAYERINDKLVGLLVRARRHNLLEFPGEMLYQGQDDRVLITLYKVPTLDELELKYMEFSKPTEQKNPEHSAQ